MSPGEWLTAIKDILVLLAVFALGYMIYSWGESRVQKQDLVALQKQITNNASIEEGWHNNVTNSQTKATKAINDLHDAVTQQPPVIVRVSPESRPVPGHTPASGGCSPAQPGGATAGNGGAVPAAAGTADLRPVLNAFELKYGKALAECRSLWDSWPSSPPARSR